MKVDDSFFEKKKDFWPNIEEIDLSFTRITSKTLSILPNRKNLKKINVQGCQIGDELALALQSYIIEEFALEELNISDTNITELFFTTLSTIQITQKDFKPRTIKIQSSNCLRILSNKGPLRQAALNRTPPLFVSSLQLTNCMDLSDKSLAHIIHMLAPCFSQHLIRLDLTCCDQLTDVGLCCVAHCCKNLTDLILWGCSSITDSGVASISRGCRNIQLLDLTGCTKITDVSCLILSGKKGISAVYDTIENEKQREKIQMKEGKIKSDKRNNIKVKEQDKNKKDKQDKRINKSFGELIKDTNKRILDTCSKDGGKILYRNILDNLKDLIQGKYDQKQDNNNQKENEWRSDNQNILTASSIVYDRPPSTILSTGMFAYNASDSNQVLSQTTSVVLEQRKQHSPSNQQPHQRQNTPPKPLYQQQSRPHSQQDKKDPQLNKQGKQINNKMNTSSPSSNSRPSTPPKPLITGNATPSRLLNLPIQQQQNEQSHQLAQPLTMPKIPLITPPLSNRSSRPSSSKEQSNIQPPSRLPPIIQQSSQSQTMKEKPKSASKEKGNIQILNIQSKDIDKHKTKEKSQLTTSNKSGINSQPSSIPSQSQQPKSQSSTQSIFSSSVPQLICTLNDSEFGCSDLRTLIFSHISLSNVSLFALAHGCPSISYLDIHCASSLIDADALIALIPMFTSSNTNIKNERENIQVQNEIDLKNRNKFILVIGGMIKAVGASKELHKTCKSLQIVYQQ